VAASAAAGAAANASRVVSRASLRIGGKNPGTWSR
jgi:hypothetical protein